MTATPLRTPLHDWHVSQRARMVDFAGWSLPVQYTSIVEEHQSTRRAVGLFDISHMGRLQFEGPNAAAFLDGLVTRRVADMAPGKIRYALVTNERGGILDDVLVYHLTDARGQSFYQMVVNAGNRGKIVRWIASRAGAAGVEFADQSLGTAMIAVQGPQAVATAGPLLGLDLARLSYYSGAVTTVCGYPCLVSRTGYTGEDGCELVVDKAVARPVWDALLAEGGPRGARAVGLGARDTLRLEAAMPLYGHELNETIDPFQAGLRFAVQLAGREFPGAEALRARRDEPPAYVRVGLQLEGKRVPREHCAVLDGETVVGEVTSGTYSPTFDKPLAMAYVRPRAAETGRGLLVDIRGRAAAAVVVPLPFYTRPAR